MEKLLDIKSFPLGVRFHPTNEELIMYYLKKKVLGKLLVPQIISEVDVNKFAPWELPAMAYLKSRDRNWYFFCPRSKKYPTGGKVNRSTKWGYWKSTGEDKDVEHASRVVGKIKHLVFHTGKAPKGERTNWVIHEYRLEDKLLADKGVSQDSYVICKLFEKSGAGPKNGEDYGAHFVEEEWDSDTDDNVQETATPTPNPFTAAAAATPTMTSSSVDASMGAPCITATPVDMSCGHLGSAIGTPFAAASTATSFTAAATPFTDIGTTSSSATFIPVDMSCGHLDSAIGTPFAAASTAATPTSFTAAATPATATPFTDIGTTSSSTTFMGTTSMGSPCVFPSTEEEVDRLLKYFTQDAGDYSDIYIGLEDLSGPSVQHTDIGDSYIEMNDLYR